MTTGRLDADRVRALFQELSDRLAAGGEQATLFVVGGAAMALAYDQNRSTRDVDALFVPAPLVREIAEQIGLAHGLETDWLNDAAKGFLPGGDDAPVVVFESESLLVQVPSAGYLLAMKLHASRDERDLDDAATLFNTLGYTTAQDGIDLLTRWYPVGQLLPRHRYIAQDVAERAATRRDAIDAAVESDEVAVRKAELRAKMAEVERQATMPRPTRSRTPQDAPDGGARAPGSVTGSTSPRRPDPDPPGRGL